MTIGEIAALAGILISLITVIGAVERRAAETKARLDELKRRVDALETKLGELGEFIMYGVFPSDKRLRDGEDEWS